MLISSSLQDVQHLTVSEPFLRFDSILSEGPIYRPEDDTIHFVDIKASQIHRASVSGPLDHQVLNIEDSVGVACFIHGDPDHYIVAAKKGFAKVNQQTGELTYLQKIWKSGEEEKRMRFNDGAIDCKGRFWAGGMFDFPYENDAYPYGTPEPKGVLFRYDPDGSVHRMIENVIIPNGIGWSPDNRIMYFTDSPRYTIWAYDFDAESGTITNRRVFVKLESADEDKHKPEPDGLAVDEEGHVWSAIWGGCKVIRFSPQGCRVGEIHLPALRVSCPGFGGMNMDELLITTAALDEDDHEGRKRYVDNGCIFRVKVGVKGLPRHRFGQP